MLAIPAALRNAHDLRAAGRVAEAEAVIREILSCDSAHFGALVTLGQLLRQQGNLAESLTCFEMATSADPSHVGAGLEVARGLQALDRLPEAEQRLREILANHHKNIAALIALGLVQRQLGRHNESLACFQNAADIDPEHSGVKFETGNSLRALNRLPEAESMFRDVLSITPNHLGALIALGQMLRQRSDYSGSLSLFEQAASVDANHIGVGMEIGRALQSLGRLPEAKQAFQKVLSKSPGHLPAMMAFGTILRLLGEREAALDCFEKATELDPDHVGAKLEAAHELRALRRIAESEAAFRAILSAAPKNTNASIALGQLLRQRGAFAESLTCLQSAVSVDPTHVGARVELGHTLRTLGRLSEAEALFRKLIAEAPEHPAAYSGLGSLLIEQFKLDEAEAIFRQALKRKPGTLQAEIGLGQVERRRGNREQAIAHFIKAASIDPSNVGVKIETAVELKDLGRYDEADQILSSVVALDSTNLAALSQRGHLHRAMGNNEHALREFEKAFELHPYHLPALVEMAVDARLLGDPERSKHYLEQALNKDPTNLAALLQSAEHALLEEDLDLALQFCQRATAAHPESIRPFIMACRVHVDRAEMNEARGVLDLAEQRGGLNPEILCLRLEVEIRAGELTRAQSMIDAAWAAYGSFFPFWARATRLAIDTGRSAKTDFATPPAATTIERSQVRGLQGYLAEAKGQLDQAIAHYREAIVLNPRSPHYFDLSRASLLVLDLDQSREAMRQSLEVNRSMHTMRGQRIRVSQTHIGQLLDEILLDHSSYDQLKRIAAEPADLALVSLKGLVASTPDYTPAAIFYIMALQRHGLLVEDLPDGASPALGSIPKRIAQFWDFSPPEDVLELSRSWAGMNTDYEHTLFDITSARAFIKDNASSEVLTAFNRAAHAAQKADIFRLAYLLVKGGYYVDADDRCLAPLNSWVPAGASLIAYQEDFGTIANNFLGVAPEHPVIAVALASATEAVNRGDSDVLWLSTGPGLLTRAFAQVAASDSDGARLVASSVIKRTASIRQAGVAIHCYLSYKKSDKHWSRAEYLRSSRQNGRLSQSQRAFRDMRDMTGGQTAI